MRIGLTIDAPSTVVADAQQAEELGFDFLACGEHADAEWARKTGIAAVSAAYHQDFSALAERYLLLGDPESVAARLAEFAEAGVETVVLQVAAESSSDRHRIISSLAEAVIPLAKDL